MGFSNPFRNPYTGRPRVLPMDPETQLFAGFFVLILIIAGWSFWNLTVVSDDCDRRGGVVVRDAYNMPACVAAPPRPPPK